MPNRNFESNGITLLNEDCMRGIKKLPDESVSLVLTSPPYCMKKAYENLDDDIETFQKNNIAILRECFRVLKKGGSLCWQVGYHVQHSRIIPLDVVVYNIVEKLNNSISEQERLILRNRIVWTFGHGLNSEFRFSGRHEVVLWFTKGEKYLFNLDCGRVPQKYPGKKASRGKKKGEYSGNPLGKNPSDVWDIPNVKSRHVEKTEHPCQFPEALAQRLILALTDKNETVLDPYLGSGTTALACYLNDRKCIGYEIDPGYFDIATNRIVQALNGDIKIREDVPVIPPNPRTKVAQRPAQFDGAKNNE